MACNLFNVVEFKRKNEIEKSGNLKDDLSTLTTVNEEDKDEWLNM